MINLNEKDTERYHEMFKKLDTNSDGKIDVYDLIVLFDKIKHSNHQNEEKLGMKKESSLAKAKVKSKFYDLNKSLAKNIF